MAQPYQRTRLGGAAASAVEEHLPAREGSAVVEGMHTADVALAAACLAGEPSALSALEHGPIAAAKAALLARGLRADDVEETLQLLREKLLVAGPARPKLAEYSGRGPLASWVRMVAIRLALNLLRSMHAPAVTTERTLENALAPAASPELAFIKARYRGAFRSAFASAVASLEPRSRTVLRLHLLDGVSTSQLAPVYKVDPSSIRRWVAEAREQILRATRQALAEKLRLTSSELDSLIALLATQLDDSVRRLL